MTPVLSTEAAYNGWQSLCRSPAQQAWAADQLIKKGGRHLGLIASLLGHSPSVSGAAQVWLELRWWALSSPL